MIMAEKSAGERAEEKARSKLTPYEWRVLRKKLSIRKNLTSFQKEFRKQLKTFITGAFAFVAALLWRDAIISFLDSYRGTIEDALPLKEAWITETVIAFLVSVMAIVAIIGVSKLLETDSK
jgi:hypothetical protein